MTAAGIVDSHHHLWDTNALRYPLFDEIEELNRPFTAPDYEREAQQRGISTSICVEAASAGADGRRETEWLLREIEASATIAGVIAWAPLERPDLDCYLHWLGTLGGKPIVGVRRSFEFEDDDFALLPALTEGARLAGDRGLIVDLVLFARSLTATIVLVDACPTTQFVLDHLGKPPIRERRWQPWADELRELSLRPNIVCKLSGLPTEADKATWTVAELRPYVEHAFGCFGPERVLFGTDWPVVDLAGGAGRWLAAVSELLREMAAPARSAVLADNARRIYRLAASGDRPADALG